MYSKLAYSLRLQMCSSHTVVCGLEIERLQSTEVFCSLCLELGLTRLDDLYAWGVPLEVIFSHSDGDLKVSELNFERWRLQQLWPTKFYTRTQKQSMGTSAYLYTAFSYMITSSDCTVGLLPIYGHGLKSICLELFEFHLIR